MAEADAVVYVEWIDSESHGQWETVADAQRAAAKTWEDRCRTLGYLVADEPDYVAITHTRLDRTAGPDVLGVVVIPRIAITLFQEVVWV